MTFKKEIKEIISRTSGVEYSRLSGVKCPVCQTILLKKAGIYRTLAWEDDNRIRYHICPVCSVPFKSIESA